MCLHVAIQKCNAMYNCTMYISILNTPCLVSMQKEGGATHLTNEAKNTFYRKTFLLPRQNTFFTRKKYFLVMREPVNENRPNEGLYFNGVNGRSKDKKMGSKRRVGRWKDGKCNVVISCSKGEVYYVMCTDLLTTAIERALFCFPSKGFFSWAPTMGSTEAKEKQRNSRKNCFNPYFSMVPCKSRKKGNKFNMSSYLSIAGHRRSEEE